MSLKFFQFVVVLPALFLAACSGWPAGVTPPDHGVGEMVSDPFKTVVNEQGGVSVAITPLNLSAAATTLDFEVALDTHSVDLSMDMATLATLAADTGRQATATRWDAPRGGHHVVGVLSFPAIIDGVSLLDGASRLTITLRNVDVPERTFTWDVSS